MIKIDYGIDGRDVFLLAFLSKKDDDDMVIFEIGILGLYFVFVYTIDL